ncbi:MAG TPA: NAD(P)H-dependent oxidoreductase subunit E [Anaerolineae bacterium]|nr:NAD(P)H-dependent oxidoreductase subunit E [Anaerolineae bacterium]
MEEYMTPEMEKPILPILKELQGQHRCITPDMMVEVAEASGATVGDVYGVATFYSFLSVKLLGEHVIMVCKSIPCWMKNSDLVVKTIEQELHCRVGETSEDGKFSLLAVNCIGACDQAPAMMVDGQVYGDLTPEKVLEILSQLGR